MGGDTCFIICNFGMGNDNIIRWNSLIELAEQVKIHFCPSHQKRLCTQLADSLKTVPSATHLMKYGILSLGSHFSLFYRRVSTLYLILLNSPRALLSISITASPFPSSMPLSFWYSLTIVAIIFEHDFSMKMMF